MYCCVAALLVGPLRRKRWPRRAHERDEAPSGGGPPRQRGREADERALEELLAAMQKAADGDFTVRLRARAGPTSSATSSGRSTRCSSATPR